jgi:predicted DNA-binding transcriptional regulator AlpA
VAESLERDRAGSGDRASHFGTGRSLPLTTGGPFGTLAMLGSDVVEVEVAMVTVKRPGRPTTGAGTPGVGAATVSPLMTADELAGWLHCSRRAVYDRVYRGQLPGMVRVGRRVYFLRESVLAFLREGSDQRSWRSR